MVSSLQILASGSDPALGDKGMLTPRQPQILAVMPYMERLLHFVSWTVALMLLAEQVSSMPKGVIDALFIFFQPILPFLLMLWLWIVVVWYFEQRGIRYEHCFAAEHNRYLVSSGILTRIAAAFTTALAIGVIVFLLLFRNGFVVAASMLPGLMIVCLALMLGNPLDGVYDNSFTSQRWFFLNTLGRVVLPVRVRCTLYLTFGPACCERARLHVARCPSTAAASQACCTVSINSSSQSARGSVPKQRHDALSPCACFSTAQAAACR
jgi:hypothetical protein